MEDRTGKQLQLLAAWASIIGLLITVVLFVIPKLSGGSSSETPGSRTADTVSAAETTSTTAPTIETTTVTSALTATYLSDIGAVEGSPEHDGTITGTPYPHSVVIGCYDGGDFWNYDFTLARHWHTLTATVALDDSTQTGISAKFEASDAVSGAMLYQRTLRTGETDQLRVNVAGLFRIRLGLTCSKYTPGRLSLTYNGAGVYGDARLSM